MKKRSGHMVSSSPSCSRGAARLHVCCQRKIPESISFVRRPDLSLLSELADALTLSLLSVSPSTASSALLGSDAPQESVLESKPSSANKSLLTRLTGKKTLHKWQDPFSASLPIRASIQIPLLAAGSEHVRDELEAAFQPRPWILGDTIMSLSAGDASAAVWVLSVPVAVVPTPDVFLRSIHSESQESDRGRKKMRKNKFQI